MGDTQADVLRVVTTDALMGTTIRNRQLGHASDTHELWFKDTSGTSYQYAAQEYNTHYANIYGQEYIYHEGDEDTYIRFQTDQIDLYAGNQAMIRLEEGANDYVLIGPDSSDIYCGIGTTDPARNLEVSGNTATTNAVQFVHRFSSYCSGVADDGFGVGVEYQIEDGTDTNTTVLGSSYKTSWVTVNDETQIQITGYFSSAEKTWLTFDNSGIKVGDGTQAVDQRILFDTLNATGNITLDDTNAHFSFDSEIRQSNTSWEDVNIDLSPLQSGGTKPGFATVGSTSIRLLAFAAGEEVDGTVEIPHNYKLGGDIQPHIHFCPLAAPTGTDYVKWEVEYFIVDHNGVVTTATSIDSGDVAVDTDDERVDANIGSPFTHATLGGQIGFKVKRVTATGDAFAGECGVLTFGFHYEVDSLGSDEITTKG